ncbi:hypothetical protein ACKWTF_015744 [Chironomus riparius]
MKISSETLPKYIKLAAANPFMCDEQFIPSKLKHPDFIWHSKISDIQLLFKNSPNPTNEQRKTCSMKRSLEPDKMLMTLWMNLDSWRISAQICWEILEKFSFLHRMWLRR